METTAEVKAAGDRKARLRRKLDIVTAVGKSKRNGSRDDIRVTLSHDAFAPAARVMTSIARARQRLSDCIRPDFSHIEACNVCQVLLEMGGGQSGLRLLVESTMADDVGPLEVAVGLRDDVLLAALLKVRARPLHYALYFCMISLYARTHPPWVPALIPPSRLLL